jgi:MFS superfamily sulfate permease-like transporter
MEVNRTESSTSARFPSLSPPNNGGFVSFSGQIGALFGLEMVKKSGIEGIVGTWIDIVENFDSIRVSDTVLGLSCTVILLAMRVKPDLRTG